MYQFIKDISSGIAPFGAAFVAYLLGLRAYRIQREYELVRRRYLDEGLDSFAADVEHALGVFNNNWQISLTILKHYREMDRSMRKDLLDTGWMDIQMSQFRVRPNYRLNALVGDQAFWNAQQLLFAFVMNSTAFFREDLCGAVRHAIFGGTLKVTKQEMIDEYIRQCKTRLETANNYHILLGAIQTVITEFEQERFTLSTIHSFKDRPVVKRCVERVKEAFASEIANL